MGLCFYRLNHHDGIVDHGADDQHEGEEREHVEREADGVDDGQCGDERHDDGNGGDDGGAPALQEDEHHEDDQQQGLCQGLENAGNGGVKEVLLRLDILDDDTRRQRLADVLHLAVNLLDNLVGI